MRSICQLKRLSSARTNRFGTSKAVSDFYSRHNLTKDEKKEKPKELKLKPIAMANPTQFLEQNFERVGIEKLTLEQIVSSPIILKERAKSEAQREAHLREVEKEKELLNKRLQEAGSNNPGLKYAYYQEVIRRLDERLEQYRRKGASPEIIKSIRENIIVSPDDAYDSSSYPVYPGSNKGKYPEDDPEFYVKWMRENMIPAARRLEELIHAWELKRLEAQEDEHRQESVNPGTQPIEKVDNSQGEVFKAHHLLGSDINYKSFLTTADDDEDDESMSFFMECPKEVHSFSKTDIPTIPSNLSIERQAQTSQIIDWDMMHSAVLIREFANWVNKRNEELNGVREEEEDPFKDGYYPTLFSYYNLLPKHIREHPAVVTALFGLEKKMGRIDLRERQEILNKVCRMVCPDPESKLIRLEGRCGRCAAQSQVVPDCTRLHSHDRPLEHGRRFY